MEKSQKVQTFEESRSLENTVGVRKSRNCNKRNKQKTTEHTNKAQTFFNVKITKKTIKKKKPSTTHKQINYIYFYLLKPGGNKI